MLDVPGGGEATIKLRLCDRESMPSESPLGTEFDAIFTSRKAEADDFYDGILPPYMTMEQRNVSRQAYAGDLQTFRQLSIRRLAIRLQTKH